MKDSTPPLEPKRFSPRNFLRARRPERFSDSAPLERPTLNRLELEYYLDSLTSRSQERDFEEFARQLAEKEICPNLLPHTGPTGGGDSKVDSETYPVAETLSAGWFVGTGDRAGKERWAFAMSAKKDWRAKVRADVTAIASTGRGYVKAFFISNQYIKDKDRSAEEDTLRKKHGFDVRILDRTWILDRVFTNQREHLAISTLRLTVPTATESQKGPLDIQRERDLKELELRIESALPGPPSLALVDDCLEAAFIARNLELPRHDIDGRFVRAQRLAADHGTRHQQVVAHYQQAWTSFWWYEDLPEFLRKYADVEKLVIGTGNVSDAELLSNLWTLLASSVRRDDISRESADLDRRTRDLLETLDRLSSDDERPSVALEARALRALMDLIVAIPEVNEQALRDLRRVVADSDGLIGFSLVRVGNLITEISDAFVGNSTFTGLFEALADATAKRQGEVARARMLLKRGEAELMARRPYDAIRTVGRVLGDLYKHESRGAMVRSLLICASAYESVGLLWASRGALLNAASIAANEWWRASTVHPALQRSANRLKWVELQLGRIPQALAWHELDRAARSALVAEGYAADRLAVGERDFDAILGILLLRADVWQLKQMVRLPESLIRLDLQMAATCLTFALGDDEDFEVEGKTVTATEQAQMFRKLADQPVAAELPVSPLLCIERTQTMRSVVLGCTVEVNADHLPSCIALAESILAAAEGLLATSITEGIIPLASVFPIRIRRSDFATFPFSFEISESGGLLGAEVRCSTFQPSGLHPEQQQALKDSIADLLTQILARGFFIAGRDTIERVIGEERGLQRAINFTGSFGAIANVLGRSPKTALEDWTPTSNEVVELRRREEWDAEARRQVRAGQGTPAPREELIPGEGPTPPGLADLSGVKHSDVTFDSVVRLPLWDKAKWRAIGWAAIPGSRQYPPWMILGFEDRHGAAELLTQLVKDVGTDDPANRLRITIVRGISRRNPSHYRVLVGTNMDRAKFKKIGATMFRVHTMTPASTENLDQFLASFQTVGAFLLGVGVVDTKSLRPPVAMRHGYVLKRHVNVREAWQIGVNDIDIAGVLPDDDVQIPAGHEADAPVLQLLEWKREKRQGRELFHGGDSRPSANKNGRRTKRARKEKRRNRRKR